MMSETVKNITLQNNYNYTTQIRKKKRTINHKNEEGQKQRSAKKKRTKKGRKKEARDTIRKECNKKRKEQ